jgi:type IV secretory pathway VirB4 component
VDRFADHNPTRLVVGTSGAGKSYAAKLELTRQLAAGTRAVVVDPEGEFGALAHALGGLCLTVGEEPAGLDPVGLACRTTLSPAEGLSVLTAWASALLAAPLGPVDLALVDRALAVLRADRLTQPTTSDLLSVIADLAAHPPFIGADLPARLAPASGGALGDLFAPNPDLADPPDLVVFDLRAVPDRARPAVMACVLTWAWSEAVRTGPSRSRLVVVDEAHLLLDDPAAARLLVQFARRARKYGVGLDVVTQRLSDFLRHPTGEAVLANAATKLLLGCEDHERTAVTTGLGLSRAEAALLRPGTRGSGLLVTPHLRTPIQVVAAPAEHVLASSGPR